MYSDIISNRALGAGAPSSRAFAIATCMIGEVNSPKNQVMLVDIRIVQKSLDFFLPYFYDEYAEKIYIGNV